ncbi:protein kinase [Metarhizium robertsii]|uniref:Protein kinase, catalytic domain protein n=2 Tax=Metarhizium robertsii TaxID=568076 RepID=E9FBD2_METRA|nr:Protein kinase, catalytic domain protein [Metarhizium robertsii ARSEF 23]EFY95003.1 Protein kinase, catalytic domain protein [Metarhizium robertsii ARSEF 23]EXU96426.1 protein kinase [Metarhizium robertsii]
MSIQHQFPDVHWVWKGGISFVYEVHPRIVVKVPKSGEFEREQFRKEVKIYDIFSRHEPCPSIVQCFLYTDNGIFLEYMRDVSLCSRIQDNQVRDQETTIVTEVKKLEPLPLRKTWMNDLAQAVAFLESLNLAHGDLRPENILLDRNRLKLSDFDCTAKIGTDFEACMAPYGRVLDSNEPDQGRRGTAGFLGPRTEQFALGSLYYLINYGFEVYGDRCLTEDPKEHGPKVVNLLQNMKFPELDGDPLIDDIIVKCWHNEYTTIAELAAYTRKLLPERSVEKNIKSEILAISRWRAIIGRAIRGLWNSVRYWCELVLCRKGARTNLEVVGSGEPNSHYRDMDRNHLAEELPSGRAYCQDLEKRGLLDLLLLGEPEKLGFTLEWYRHSCSG